VKFVADEDVDYPIVERLRNEDLQAELNEVFEQVDEIRDPSLEVSSDEEAMEVANEEVEQRRKEKK